MALRRSFALTLLLTLCVLSGLEARPMESYAAELHATESAEGTATESHEALATESYEETATESQQVPATESSGETATESQEVEAAESYEETATESQEVEAAESYEETATESQEVEAAESYEETATESQEVEAAESYEETATESQEVEAAESEAEEGQEGESGCHSPPVGQWDMIHNFPNADAEGFFVGAESTFTLNQVTETIYTGSGMGHRVYPSIGPDVPFTLLAIFDAEDCTLSGSAYNFEGQGMDVFLWHVFDGGAMHGGYIASANDTVIFPRLGRHDVRYVNQNN